MLEMAPATSPFDGTKSELAGMVPALGIILFKVFFNTWTKGAR